MSPACRLHVEALALSGERNRAKRSEYDAPNRLFVQIRQPHAGAGIVDDLLDRFGSIPLDDVNRLVILLQQSNRIIVGSRQSNDSNRASSGLAQDRANLRK